MEVDSGFRTIAWGCCWSSPGGLARLSAPRAPSGGGALILYNFESNIQSVFLSRHEKIRVLYVGKKFRGYGPLTNEINASSYLYLYWHVGSVYLVAHTQAKTQRSIVREADSRCDIDWSIFNPPVRAFEGVSVEGGLSGRSNAGRMFVADSYTYLGGDAQTLGCRRLRGIICICGAVEYCLCHHEGARTSPGWRCVLSVGKLY